MHTIFGCDDLSVKKLFFYFLNFIIVGFIGFSLVYHPSFGGAVIVPKKIYVIYAVATLVIAAVLGVLEKKFCYFEKFFSFVYAKRKALLGVLITAVVSCGVAAGAEFILGKVFFGVSSNGSFFNIYRFYFLWGIAYLVFYLVYHIAKGIIKAENAFLTIALTTGLVMIFVSPFSHNCWDVESHYAFSLAESSVGGHYTAAYDAIRNISDDYIPKSSAIENERNIIALNELDKTYAGNLGNSLSLPHLPAAISLAVGRLFGLSFYMKECLAKLANVLFYSLIVYFAIKKLKDGKMIFFVLGLIPINIFLAANINYDWWVNSFMMLGVAYFISEYSNQNKQTSAKDTIIMCGAFALACLPKQVYFPILLLPFLLKKEQFVLKSAQKKRYFLICLAAIIFVLVSFVLRSVSEISSGGDMRGGAEISTIGQIKFILSSPVKYFVILVKFLWNYLSLENVGHSFCHFAYLGVGAGFTILVIMLIAAVLTDKFECDIAYLCTKNRIFVGLISIAQIVLVPTALYVAFTPVGFETINGCQTRYLMPVLITALPFFGSKKITNKMNRSHYIGLFAIGCSVSLFISIYDTMLLKML